jgi:hypothetical protein
MKKDLVLRNRDFDKLVIDLRKIIDAGRARAQASANYELMRTYWGCGERIARERLTENSGYGESVMERLANELHADRTTSGAVRPLPSSIIPRASPKTLL